MVALAGLAVFLSGPGQTYSVSTFIDSVMAEYNWSRSLVSSLYSMGTLLAGCFMMFVGRQVDQKGYRLMLTLVSILFSGALLFMSTVRTPLMLFIGFFLIRAFGQGSLTLIPYSLVPQWFIRMRGRALSVLAVCAALSSAALPYINLGITHALGWRYMWLFWSAVLCLVLAPLAWFFTKNNPEEIGLLPDGGLNPVGLDSGSPQLQEHSFTQKQAMQTKAFWLILVVVCIPSMVGTGAQFHHLSIMAENGVAPQIAASVFAVAAGVALGFTPIAGVLCDRYPVRYVLAAALLLQCVNLVLLLFTYTTTQVVLLGVVQGTRQAMLSVAGGVVWPHYFGRANLASIRGVTTAGMVIGSALGPMPFGAGYDFFGGYLEIILAMSLLPLLGAAGIMFLKKPERPDGPATSNTALAS